MDNLYGATIYLVERPKFFRQMKFSSHAAENSILNLLNGGDPSDKVLPPRGGILHPSRIGAGIKKTLKNDYLI